MSDFDLVPPAVWRFRELGEWTGITDRTPRENAAPKNCPSQSAGASQYRFFRVSGSSQAGRRSATVPEVTMSAAASHQPSNRSPSRSRDTGSCSSPSAESRQAELRYPQSGHGEVEGFGVNAGLSHRFRISPYATVLPARAAPLQLPALCSHHSAVSGWSVEEQSGPGDLLGIRFAAA